MAAQAATSNRPVSRRLSPAVVRLLHALTITTAVMLLFLALWLLARRVGGQLQRPLNAPTLVLVAITLASLTSWLRIVWHYTGLRLSRRNGRAALAWTYPSVVVLLLAVALSIAGTGTARLLLFWGILVVVEGGWWWIAWRQLRATAQPSASESLASAAGSPASSLTQGVASESDVERDIEQDDVDEQLPDEVSQQITRTFAESEEDTVTGILRARLARNERSQSLHVAICPPMLRPPRVTAVQISGSRARIKAADAQSFGIRFDLRLATASAEAQEVLIHFEARCAKPDSTGLGGFRA